MAISTIDTTTLCCVGSTTTGIIKGDIEISPSALSTTASTAATALTSIPINIDVQIGATRDYVSAMSVEQIDNMIAMIDEKEAIMLNEPDSITIEEPVIDNHVKVKTLGSKHI